MKALYKNILVFAGLGLALLACATPQVYTPNPDKAAVARERDIQAQMANGAKAAGNDYKGGMQSPEYYLSVLKNVAPKIKNGGVEVCQGIGKKGCNFGFNLINSKELNAFADGKNVHITMGMMAFAGNEEDIAFILAHEYAHNVLQHVASTQKNATVGGLLGMVVEQGLKSQGVNLGVSGAQLGAKFAQMKYSKSFEEESDHVGLYIAKHAGYNISNAPHIWRRMSVEMPQAIYSGQTHPTNPERFVAMNQTIEQIGIKSSQGAPLLPDLKKK